MKWIIRFLCLVVAVIINNLQGDFFPTLATDDASALLLGGFSGILTIAIYVAFFFLSRYLVNGWENYSSKFSFNRTNRKITKELHPDIMPSDPAPDIDFSGPSNSQRINTSMQYRKHHIIEAVLVIMLFVCVVCSLLYCVNLNSQIRLLEDQADDFASLSNDKYNEGYASGKHEGYTSGHDVGYSSGKIDGYSEGHNIGYLEGYKNGCLASKDDEFYKAGYCAGYKDAVTDYADETVINNFDNYALSYSSQTHDGYYAWIMFQRALLHR